MNRPSNAPSGIQTLTDEVLRANFDPRSLKRGVGYANDRKVRVTESDVGHLAGESEGSHAQTYDVDVDWQSTSRGIQINGVCSCPVGFNCKHAAALILTARRDAEMLLTTTTTDITSTVPTESPASAATALTVFQPSANWRASFDQIRQSDNNEDLLRPLAIEFTLKTSKATQYNPHPRTNVAIRPMKMGAKGKWIKSGISWSDLSYASAYSLRDIKPSHGAALTTIARMSKGNYYGAGQSRDLGSFGEEIWPALQRAIDSGVVLIPGPSTGTAVELDSTPATLKIDLQADADGNIVVTTVFDHDRLHAATSADNSPAAATATAAVTIDVVGSPTHGLYHFDGSTLTLILLEHQLSPEISKLASSPPVVVPTDDTDEFLDVYTPLLASHGRVRSADGSVTVTESLFDRLVMIIQRESIERATIHWAARYMRGDRARLHLLGTLSSRGRDMAAERQAVKELELPEHLALSRRIALGADAGELWPTTTRGYDTVALLNDVVPWLIERDQIAIDVRGDLPELREATTDPLISLAIDDATDARGSDSRGTAKADTAKTTVKSPDPQRADWFDLSVEVSVDGQVIEFADLFAALSMGLPLMVLDSGTWLRLDRPEFNRLRELITEAQGLADRVSGDVRLTINRFQSSWWEELAGLGVIERQSTRWAQSIGRLNEATAPTPIATPSGLQATLRPYQHQGLDWLGFLHRHELGGILADDMGLGKTIQTLALFLHVKEADPTARFLVIAPTSVVENWHREANQFAPDLVVRTITESQKRRGTTLAEEIDGVDVVVTSYALFRIEFDDYQSHEWNMAVLDEAQFVKNHKGKTYQCVRRLSARTKLAITGTPLENSLMDLWSLLSITAPGLYPDPKRFAEVYQKPIESGRSPQLLATLRRRISPLMRRRTKSEVLEELPPKIESIVEIELNSKHSRIYQTQLQRQRQKVLGLVDDMQKNRFEILKSLTLLRQLSLDPGLVDPAHEGVGSAKLDHLIEDITQVVAEGHKALVFSQFTRFLARVRARLDDVGIEYSYLDGRTRKREQAISAFKDGDVPVFVISLKAGGFGLNLTEADYCFVLDPWWNPAVEAQAVDRTHRIGQQNRVMVYRYVSAGTIEEKVVELQQRKAALFSSVMDADGSLSGALSAEDIRALFD